MVKTTAKNEKELARRKTLYSTPPRIRRKIKPSFTPSKKEVKDRLSHHFPLKWDKWDSIYGSYEGYKRLCFNECASRPGDVWYEGTYRDMVFNSGKTESLVFEGRFDGFCRPLYAYLLFVEKRLVMEVKGGNGICFTDISYGTKRTVERKRENVWEKCQCCVPEVEIDGEMVSLLDITFKLKYQ